MEMRIASINLDSVDFERLDGVRPAYPIPMPIFAKRSSEDTYLVYSIVDRLHWSQVASIEQRLEGVEMSKIPLSIPSDVFEREFLSIGGGDGLDGLYAKRPSPVMSLLVEVPCSYNNSSKMNTVEPFSVVIRTSSGLFRHFDEKDFEQKFVSSIDDLKDMKVEVRFKKSPELESELAVS